MTSVVKIKKDEVIYFKAFLSSRNDVSLQEIKSPHESFRGKSNGNTIVGYTSGNIVINSDELKPIVNEVLFEIRKHKLDFNFVIGSDETGKGEWLGPLTIAAVALDPDQVLYLQSEGVKDSKELSADRILLLSNLIKKNSVGYEIKSIYPIEFNYLFSKRKEDGKNLNDILAEGHYFVIDKVMNKIKRINTKIKIVIDEFDSVKTNQQMMKLSNISNIELLQKPRAEDEIAVAAASIVAKSEREKILDELSKKYNIDVRKLEPDKIMDELYAEDIVKIDYIKKKENG